MADPILAPLAELFADEVTVEAHLSDDVYGTPAYAATGVVVAARVIGKHQLVRAMDGQERVSRVQAWLASGQVSVRDRFTLPVRFGNDLAARQPPAIALEWQTDENGPHHQKVFF